MVLAGNTMSNDVGVCCFARCGVRDLGVKGGLQVVYDADYYTTVSYTHLFFNNDNH